MTQYNAALIGLGKIAWKLGAEKNAGSSLSHASAYTSNIDTQLIGGFSTNSAEVNSFISDGKRAGYSDLSKMLEDLDPDIVSICSPTAFHAEHLTACINHGVPMIWLEKPPAESINQLQQLELMRRQASSPSKVLVNYQRRYTGSYRKLKTLLADKYYGEILLVEIRYSKGLVTNGSHMLDIIFFLFGEQDCTINWVERDNLSDNPGAIIRLSSGLLIYIIGYSTDFHNIDIVVTCEKGRLSILHGGMTSRVEEKIEHELFPGYFRLSDVANDILGGAGFNYAFDKALSDLISSHELDKEPQSSLTTACSGMQLLEKILTKVNE